MSLYYYSKVFFRSCVVSITPPPHFITETTGYDPARIARNHRLAKDKAWVYRGRSASFRHSITLTLIFVLDSKGSDEMLRADSKKMLDRHSLNLNTFNLNQQRKHKVM